LLVFFFCLKPGTAANLSPTTAKDQGWKPGHEVLFLILFAHFGFLGLRVHKGSHRLGSQEPSCKLLVQYFFFLFKKKLIFHHVGVHAGLSDLML
jgi:hypothetical protein